MDEGIERKSEVVTARNGVGPLLARDYWAVIANSLLRPREIMAEVRAHFASFAPDDLAAFDSAGTSEPMRSGAEVGIRIAGAGGCSVRVTHCDECSFTLATLAGHPEAGRITFGAYRNREGKVIFHIRSHARSESLLRLLGFAILGEAMQTSTWAAFVSRVAALAGEGVEGFVQAETRIISDEDDSPADQPTFIARSDD